MTPEREIWMAESAATNLAKRLAWMRNSTIDERDRHIEVARDMLRVLIDRVNAVAGSSLSSDSIEEALASRHLESQP